MEVVKVTTSLVDLVVLACLPGGIVFARAFSRHAPKTREISKFLLPIFAKRKGVLFEIDVMASTTGGDRHVISNFFCGSDSCFSDLDSPENLHFV